MYVCVYIYIEIGFQPRHFRYSTTLCFCSFSSGILTMKNEWHFFQSIEYGWCFFAGLLVINMFFISIRDDHVIQEICGNPHENQPFSIVDFPMNNIYRTKKTQILWKSLSDSQMSPWYVDFMGLLWFTSTAQLFFWFTSHGW